MPAKNYRSVTLRNIVVEKLEVVAYETKRTVPKVIEHMLDIQYPDLANEINEVENEQVC